MWKTRDGDCCHRQRLRAALLPRCEKALKTMADSYQTTGDAKAVHSLQQMTTDTAKVALGTIGEPHQA